MRYEDLAEKREVAFLFGLFLYAYSTVSTVADTYSSRRKMNLLALSYKPSVQSSTVSRSIAFFDGRITRITRMANLVDDACEIRLHIQIRTTI